MLNELDKELEARGLGFVRYADDLIIVVGSKRAAGRVMKGMTRFIEEKLGLKVNAEKSRVDKPKGIKYLGFGFYYGSKLIEPPYTERYVRWCERLGCLSANFSNT